MPWIRQHGFGHGELSPLLWARDDLREYGTGARSLRNMVVTPFGSAASRPGTIAIDEVGLISSEGRVPVRLVPFIASLGATIQSYVVVLYSGSFDVYRTPDWAKVFSGPDAMADWNAGISDGLPLDLDQVQYSQTGEILSLTHPNAPTYDITRVNELTWTAAKTSFDLLPYTGYDWRPPSIPASDGTHPARQFAYKATAVYKFEDNDETFETAARDIKLDLTGAAIPSTIVAMVDRPFVLEPHSDMERLPGGSPSLQTFLIVGGRRCHLIESRIYRGRGSVFGFIGRIGQGLSDATLRDEGDDPNYARPPPQGTNPFVGKDESGAVVRTSVPSAVGFFEQRRVYLVNPDRVLGSRVNSFLDYDQPSEEGAGLSTQQTAVEIDLAERTWEEMRSLVATDKALLVFTSGSVWAVSGANGAPIDPTGLNSARVQATIGADWPQPIALPTGIVYPTLRLSGARDIVYSNERQGYVAGDMAQHARHLFDGRRIVRWTYAPAPWGLIWAVLDNGKMLSLTYDRTRGLVAWCPHDTQGVFEDVCAVPMAGGEDAVFVVVRRNIGGTERRFLEVMGPRATVTTPVGYVGLDAALHYQGAVTKDVVGLGSALEGREVWANAGGYLSGPHVVNAGKITVDGPGAADIVVGLKFTPEVELLDAGNGETRAKGKLCKRVRVQVTGSRGLLAGESSMSHLAPWKQRRAADDFGPIPLSDDDIPISVSGTYGGGGRAFLRQDEPWPLTVVGVMREVEVGSS